jgi:hypothetical protein
MAPTASFSPTVTVQVALKEMLGTQFDDHPPKVEFDPRVSVRVTAELSGTFPTHPIPEPQIDHRRPVGWTLTGSGAQRIRIKTAARNILVLATIPRTEFRPNVHRYRYDWQRGHP